MLRANSSFDKTPVKCPRNLGEVLILYSSFGHCQSCSYRPCLAYENGAIVCTAPHLETQELPV